MTHTIIVCFYICTHALVNTLHRNNIRMHNYSQEMWPCSEHGTYRGSSAAREFYLILHDTTF